MKETATQTKTPEAAPMAAAPAQKTVFSSRPAAHPLLRLQRTVGNQAAQRYIQAKLVVGAANDVYEQEADRVAEQVMSLSASISGATDGASLQRRTSEEKEVAHARPLAASITQLVQRAPSDSSGSFEVGAAFESQLRSGGSGNPLPASTRAFMEPRFGADFGGVRLHTGSNAAQLNRTISAQAFTHGSDIYLGEGNNNLESTTGKQLLAHELTHTIQQGAAGIVTSDRADLVGRLQRGIGNVARTMSGLVQRSWVGDRIEWVRTATQTGNWAGSDPPGAYYVLNGLSMDDMVRVLRALTPTDRKKLSDNLNEHAAGFDRSRLQLALTNAAVPTGDKAFRESSENLLWAIRSGNYGNPPDGAFYQLAAAKGTQRDRLLAALNRDALDALISHKDEAGAVPGGVDVVNNIQGSRARVGQTSHEKRLHDLIEGNDFKAFFTEFNGMNETDELRFLLSADLVDISKIRHHIEAAAGIADHDRMLYLLNRATTTSTGLYIDASTATYRWQPKYRVDKPDDLSRFIRSTDAFDVEIDINTIGDAEIGEDEAERQHGEAKPGPGGFLWPANRNRSTLPNLWKMKQDVREKMWIVLGDDVLRAGIFVVQYLLNVVFPIVHGTVMRTLAALRRGSLSTRWMMGSQAIKGRLPPTVQGSVRPHATPQQLREMIADSGEYYTHRTPDGDVAANQTIVPKGQTNPMAPEGVYVARGVKGVAYGEYGVAIKGAKFPIRDVPTRAEEFIVNGEIPANEGVWYTAAEYAAAKGVK